MEETSISKLANASWNEKLPAKDGEKKKHTSKMKSKKRSSAENRKEKNKRSSKGKSPAKNGERNDCVLEIKFEKKSSVETEKNIENVKRKKKRDTLKKKSSENGNEMKKRLLKKKSSAKNINGLEKNFERVQKNKHDVLKKKLSMENSGKENYTSINQLGKNLVVNDGERNKRASKNTPNNKLVKDAGKRKCAPKDKLSVLDKIYLDKLLEINRRREMIRNGKWLPLWQRQMKCLDEHVKRIKILKLSKIHALKAAKEYLNAEKARITKDFKKNKAEMKNAIKAELLERKKKIQAEYLMCEIDESPISKNLRKKSRTQPVANTTFERKRRKFPNVRIRLDENSIQNDIEAINAIINGESNAILNAENENKNIDSFEESVFEKEGKLYYYGEWLECGQKVKVRGPDFQFKGILSIMENGCLRILKENTNYRLAISFNHLISHNVIIEKRTVGKIKKHKKVQSKKSKS